MDGWSEILWGSVVGERDIIPDGIVEENESKGAVITLVLKDKGSVMERGGGDWEHAIYDVNNKYGNQKNCDKK